VQVVALGNDAVDPRLEQIRDPGSLQYRARVGARRHHSAAEARVAGGAHVADRAFVRLDAVSLDERQHDLVLPVAERADRRLRQLDPA
jgi:hypothetical protein